MVSFGLRFLFYVFTALYLAGCGKLWLSIRTAEFASKFDPILRIQNASVTEGGTASVTAHLKYAFPQDIVFTWETRDITATTSDYTPVYATSVTIPAGSTDLALTVTTIDDAIREGDETVEIHLTNVPPGITYSNGVLTIIDDETRPSVSWTLTSQTAVENAGSVTATAELSGLNTQDVVIPITVSGTAFSLDHSATARSLTIPAGSTTANYVFTITDDALYEGDETVILTIGVPTNADTGPTSVHTVTVQDDDAQPSVNFTASTQTVNENVGTVTVQVQLSAVSGQATLVPFTVAGTASFGTDHNANAGTITIPAGTSSAQYTFTVTDDALYEASETVAFAMGTPTGASLGTTTSQVITINDNDVAPTIRFSTNAQTVAENVDTVTVRAQLSAVSGLDASVNLAVSGSASDSGVDHNATTTTLTIPAGSLNADYTFTITDDTAFESSETVLFTMNSPTASVIGTPSTHTVTITDNDTNPTVRFASASQTVMEDVGSLTVTVLMSSTSGQEVTIPFTVAGTSTSADHNASATTLTIPAGSTSVTYTFTITDDAIYDDNETIIFSLGTPTNAVVGAPTSHTVTIQDNDPQPIASFASASQTVLENVGSVTATVSLDTASGIATLIPITVSGTAGGTDHNASARTLTIPAGSLSANYTLTVTNDTLYENSETVILTMGTLTNASAGSFTVHTVTITDNDSPPAISFNSATQTVGEGAGTVTVAVKLNTASGMDAIVPITVTGTAGALDHNAANATFTISAGATTANYTFSVTDDSLSEPSETVILTLGAPTQASLGSTTVHTVTITDNEPLPSLSISDATILEASGQASVTVTANALSSQDITFNWATANNSAVSGNDYVAVSSTSATIAAGTNSRVLTVTILDDSRRELTESFSITISSPTGATISDNTSIITITDDDPAASIQNVTSSSADGSFGISSTIPIQIIFDQPVTVTGTPRLQLATAGTTNEYALYSAGSGTSTLTFNYVVVANDQSADLDYLATTALTLNGGTLNDGGGSANLTLPAPAGTGSLAANKALLIDGVAPVAPATIDDGASNSSTSTSPTITWAAATDSGGSGLSSYELAIGSSAGGSNVLTWTNVGSVTSYQASGLSLTSGTTYFASVRAIDGAGNRSSARQGNGWVVGSSGLSLQAYLKGANTEAGDSFGKSVAISGNTAIVGAYQEDSNQTTVTNGTTASSDNTLSNAGAAYIFTRVGSTWQQQAYLKAPAPSGSDYFGWSVAVSGDTALVGAYAEDSNVTTITNGTTASTDSGAAQSGAAYVFTRLGTTWTQQAFLKPSNVNAGDNFGRDTGIDGDTIVIGAMNEASSQTSITNGTGASIDNSLAGAGAAYVFQRSGTTWAQQAYLKPRYPGSNDNFGMGVAISGDTIAVAAPAEDSNQSTITNGTNASNDNSLTDSGAVYVFQRLGTTWAQQAFIKSPNPRASDYFGYGAVSLSADTLAVGDYHEASNQTTITNGTTASSNTSAANAGAVYIFRRTGTTWAQEAYLKAPNPAMNDYLGYTVGISGDYVIAGAHQEDSNQAIVTMGTTASSDNSSTDSGAAYLFKRTGTTWSMHAYLKAPNNETTDNFGQACAISGTVILCSAPKEDSSQNFVSTEASTDNAAADSGAAYIFDLSQAQVQQQAYAKAPHVGPDFYGTAVSLYGQSVAIGSPGESSSDTTITNGTTASADDSLSMSGAVYVLTQTGTTWNQQAYIKPSNAGASDAFGTTVALYSDLLLVGAPQESSNQTTVSSGTTASSDDSQLYAGAAYVFRRTSSIWSQEAYLKPPNNRAGNKFGSVLALGPNTAIIGTMYEASNQTTITNGTTASSDSSMPTSGAVYVFAYNGSTWAQEAYIKPANTTAGASFATSVALSGNTLAVGSAGEMSNETTITNSATASSDVSAPGSGAVYIYTRTGNSWSQQAYIKASNAEGMDLFGNSVALSGDTLVVGAPQESSNQTTVTNGSTSSSDNSANQSGAAYVFTRSGSSWSQTAYLKATNAEADDQFGTNVAISGETILVSTPYEKSAQTTLTNGPTASSDNSASEAGAVYVFTHSGTTWSQTAYLKAPNMSASMHYGSNISIHGNKIATGAPNESSNQTTITNGTGASSDTSLAGAGAVYILSY